MVTEELCQKIVARMYGSSCTATRTFFPDSATETRTEVVHQHSMSRHDLYDELLLQFDIREVDDAISWLKVRGFVAAFGFGLMAPEMGYSLTDKGIRYGESRTMDDEDRQRLSARTITVNPEAYGVRLNLKEMWWRARRYFQR
jgi:hypothetical protein